MLKGAHLYHAYMHLLHAGHRPRPPQLGQAISSGVLWVNNSRQKPLSFMPVGVNLF